MRFRESPRRMPSARATRSEMGEGRRCRPPLASCDAVTRKLTAGSRSSSAYPGAKRPTEREALTQFCCAPHGLSVGTLGDKRSQPEKRPHAISRRSGWRSGRWVRCQAEFRGSSATASAVSEVYASLTTATSAASSSSVAEPRMIRTSADGCSDLVTVGCSRASSAAVRCACRGATAVPWRSRRACSRVR